MAKKSCESWVTRISIGRIISVIFSLIMIFLLISILGLFTAVFFGPIPHGNIAVIHIKGYITASGDRYGGGTSAEDIVQFIQDAEKKDEIKAILLDINSGGGSAVGSDEIAIAVKSAEKPVVAVIREAGASGAYWIASAADIIYANRMSLTGSIGVIGSYLEFEGLLEDYNVTYRRLVAGEQKDMGSPFKEMTYDEEMLFQSALNQIHDFFIQAVAENRNMSEYEVRKVATGRFMIGAEAKEIGLVDVLGSKQDAVAYIEKQLNITADLADYVARPGLSSLFGVFSRNALIDGESQVSLQT
ncbi:signal peptide peptidase SppA [Candidatus Woesearchaeota archaeon]|nr:signal peptide peptidase SppA [Candidatus Woesearchaeota archaeon]